MPWTWSLLPSREQGPPLPNQKIGSRWGREWDITPPLGGREPEPPPTSLQKNGSRWGREWNMSLPCPKRAPSPPKRRKLYKEKPWSDALSHSALMRRQCPEDRHTPTLGGGIGSPCCHVGKQELTFEGEGRKGAASGCWAYFCSRKEGRHPPGVGTFLLWPISTLTRSSWTTSSSHCSPGTQGRSH